MSLVKLNKFSNFLIAEIKVDLIEGNKFIKNICKNLLYLKIFQSFDSIQVAMFITESWKFISSLEANGYAYTFNETIITCMIDKNHAYIRLSFDIQSKCTPAVAELCEILQDIVKAKHYYEDDLPECELPDLIDGYYWMLEIERYKEVEMVIAEIAELKFEAKFKFYVFQEYLYELRREVLYNKQMPMVKLLTSIHKNEYDYDGGFVTYASILSIKTVSFGVKHYLIKNVYKLKTYKLKHMSLIALI